MRIAFLTPGTGNYYCGVCMRDNSLARHLISQGHEVTMLPTYLPHFWTKKERVQEVRFFWEGSMFICSTSFPSFARRPNGWIIGSIANFSPLGGGQEGNDHSASAWRNYLVHLSGKRRTPCQRSEQSDRLV